MQSSNRPGGRGQNEFPNSPFLCNKDFHVSHDYKPHILIYVNSS